MNRQIAHYTLIRLLPHADAGEFVNVGVVLAHPAQHRLDFQLLSHVGRVTHFFPEVTAALLREVRHELRDELTRLGQRVQAGADAVATLAELCRPREALIRYAAPRTLFIRDAETALAQLMARFVARDGDEVQRRREDLLDRQVRHALADHQLAKAFTPFAVGDEDFQVRLPFVHVRAGQPRAVIKPLDLALDAPQKIFDHSDPWIQRLRRLQRMKLIPPALLIPIEAPVGDERCASAANEVMQELRRELQATVVDACEQAPVIDFARRHVA